jgi:hypothetical protein
LATCPSQISPTDSGEEAIFNPALEQGSPAAYHVAVQAQLREKYKASAAVERAGEGAAPRSGGTDSEAKGKRSTEQGEARAKLIAALTKHHQYYNGSCGNLAPIGNNDLARKAGVAKRSASAFFAKEFHGHSKYRATCHNSARLAASLKMLNGEFRPRDFYDARSPADVEADDDD